MKVTRSKNTSLNEVCTLIKDKIETDELGNDIRVIAEEKQVYCGSFAVYYNEFYKAAEQGIKSELGLIISEYDDNGADYVVYATKEYRIYRISKRPDHYIEMYLTEVTHE